MEWTEEKVYKFLNSNPQFKDLENEWSGYFKITFNIEGNCVMLSNTVEGIAECFLVPPFNKDTIHNACDFAMLARYILKRLIAKQES